ncbi:MAG: adenylosuccinate synthetase [Candidatus Paceibacterota bacterium]|jgi:adenylosuccinate synthase
MVDAFVGLQYGSEGKGKVCAMLASLYDGAVRTGAPNAGHTIYQEEKAYKMRSVPCAWVNPRCRLFIGAGGMVNVDILAKELASLPEGVVDRLRIDRNAGVITPHDMEDEEKVGMNAKNGSTAEGVGPAQARKVLRRDVTTANTSPALKPYLTNVAKELHAMLGERQRIMLEGTQGAGLSMNHGQYPFTTSRDVLASSLLSDAGLPPSECEKVYGVLRTYPIRVAGNSGPIGEETTWQDVERRCGAPEGSIVERTTVTNRIRRVGEIDWDMLRYTSALNAPDGVFLMFADYLDWRLHGSNDYGAITPGVWSFVKKVESVCHCEVLALSTGPKPEHTIWLGGAELHFPHRFMREMSERR